MAITLKTTLDASQVTIYDQAVRISGMAYEGLDNFANVMESIDGAAVDFTYYSDLAVADTALTDGTEATAVAMSDSKVTITPKEYGNVITTTRLANTSTAGKADLGAAKLVGRNKGETVASQFIATLSAGTNATAAATAGTLAKGDLRKAFEKLETARIGKFGTRYVAFCHPSQVSDIKDDYNGIVQYTDAERALSGVVGELEGFTIVSHPLVAAGTVVCFGQDAMAKAWNIVPDTTIIDGNDNLGRTRHYGWYGIYEYGILDQNAIQVITGA